MADRRYALRGRVVTMDVARTIVPDGVVWIDGDTIHSVSTPGEGRPSGFEDIEAIETHGTIFPGLIELHNHLAYNALPLWKVPRAFSNRDQWGARDDYKKLVSRPMRVLGSDPEYVAAIARFAEAKCLVGGVTASQGITLQNFSTTRFFKGLTRNVEQSLDNRLPNAQTKIGDPENVEEVRRLAEQLQRISCTLRHLSEGIDDHARKRFLDLQFEPDKWALAPAFCGIHANGLRDEDLAVMQRHGAAIVWSPLSNLLLYGKTLNVGLAAELGIRIALGSDWSPSGSRNLLGEMKIARAHAAVARARLRSADIVAMATCNAAQMLGWSGLLGSIESGKYADLVVVTGADAEPYDQLIDASEKLLRAVIIAGRVRLADPKLGLIAAADAETMTIDGIDKHLDVRDADADPLVEGLSLAAAVARLKDGLARLPEIEADLLNRAIVGDFNFRTSAARVWFLALEEDAEFLRRSWSAADRSLADMHGPPILRDVGIPGAAGLAAASPSPLSPIELDPLTIAGDANYKPALLAQQNLPQSIKDAIAAAFP